MSLVQSFFGHVLDCIRGGKNGEAQDLLASLNEPNETRLGLSVGSSAGHGMGEELAVTLWRALKDSKAVTTGLLQDLEETALFVPGIDRDIVSDIVTNIIREPLIEFTQTMAAKYSIPFVVGIAVEVWDRGKKTWSPKTVALPVAAGKPLLLVPRMFVRRRRGVLAADQYYTHFIVPYIQQKEFGAPNGLRRLLADGTAAPAYKKDIRQRYSGTKKQNIEYTEEDPQLLERYRTQAERKFEVVDHDDLAAATASDRPDFDALLAAVFAVTPGDAGATKYHYAVEALLTAMLYPALDMPVVEAHLHSGRKRVDILYTNIARHGFFHWLHSTHGTPCSFIPVECKNYSKEIKNPEVDQLSGRFGVQRGQIGILCHRGFADKARVLQRCVDTAKDGRGYIIALDDEDLKELVEERKLIGDGQEFTGLYRRFQALL